MTFSPFSRNLGLLLSIRVIARERLARSPLLIRCAKSSTESSFTLFRLNPGFIELSSDLFITSYHHSFSAGARIMRRSEEHTSELQSRGHLVCRRLLEK